jgi:hypothetical protein
MSLAVGQKKGKATFVYAGANSSPADMAKGKNEHLRVFSVESTKARAAPGADGASARIAEVSRHSLFLTRDADAYQRLLRLSAPFAGSPGPQLGALGTGLAKQSEIALFDVSPGAAPRARGRLELLREAEDLDVIQTGEGSYQVVYCTEFELHVFNVGGKNTSERPQLVYTVPHDESSGATSRPSFRRIRYLSPNFILSLLHLPKFGGVILQGLRLPSPKNETTRVAVVARLPSVTKRATALAVRNLSPAAKPTDKLGDTQFVVAVAGQERSISLYTLEHKTVQTIEVLAELLPLHTLKDVHPEQITTLSFSVFTTPKTTARPQYVKLASICVARTVIVHSIPLNRFVDKSVPLRKGGPPRPVRYITAMKPKQPTATPFFISIAIFVLLVSVLTQAYMEMYGYSRPILHAQKFLPSWYGSLRSPSSVPNEFIESLLSENVALGDTLAKQQSGGDKIVLRAEPGVSDVQADVHDESLHGEAKSWEELPAKQKSLWRDRLKGAGHWAEDMGDSVFKGVLFGELAGAVGRAVGG